MDAPGSAALATDTAFIRRLRQAGLTLNGLRFDVADAQVVEVADDTALVRATVTTSDYLEVTADGSVVRRVPRGTPRSVRLTLLRTAAGWRIAADG